MAESHLTTPQIDALLSIFRRGGSGWEDAEVESFDLSNPHRIPASALEALRVRHEQAGGRMASALKTLLGMPIQIDLESLEQVQFSVFRDRLPDPCCAILAEFKPLQEPAVIVLEHAFAFASLERVLGGKGESDREVRDLTSTEFSVLHEVVTPILEAHSEAWRIFASLKGKPSSFVGVPHFLREIPPDEVVVAARYRLRGFCGGMAISFAMPTAGLEAQLQARPRVEIAETEAEQAREHLTEHLQQVPVSMQVRIGQTQLCVRDLMQLARGDVLVLDRSVHDPLELMVEDRPRFSGHLMRRGKGLVFMVQPSHRPVGSDEEAGAEQEVG